MQKTQPITTSQHFFNNGYYMVKKNNMSMVRVRREDGGNYECQINILPLKSIIITLKVTGTIFIFA